MQVKIHVHRFYLEELSYFLKSEIPYKHTILFTDHGGDSSMSEICLFYDDYVRLKDFSSKELLNNESKNITVTLDELRSIVKESVEDARYGRRSLFPVEEQTSRITEQIWKKI